MSVLARHEEIVHVGHVLDGEAAQAMRDAARNGKARLRSLESEMARVESDLAYRRSLLARYASMTRHRHARDVETATRRVSDDLALREAQATDKIALSRAAALTGAYESAMESARKDLNAIVGTALRRIVGDMTPQERVSAVIDAALSEVMGNRRIALRVHPDNVGAVERTVHSRLGDRWENAVSIEHAPALALDAVEVSAADGRLTLAATSQIDVLMATLSDLQVTRIGEPGDE